MQEHGFKYEVKVEVTLTFDEARLLKLIAENHYDHTVRETARCGIVNGLFNCANWFYNEKDDLDIDPDRAQTTMDVTQRDVDTMLKALEQRSQLDYLLKSIPYVPLRCALLVGNEKGSGALKEFAAELQLMDDLSRSFNALFTKINDEWARLHPQYVREKK